VKDVINNKYDEYRFGRYVTSPEYINIILSLKNFGCLKDLYVMPIMEFTKPIEDINLETAIYDIHILLCYYEYTTGHNYKIAYCTEYDMRDFSTKDDSCFIAYELDNLIHYYDKPEQIKQKFNESMDYIDEAIKIMYDRNKLNTAIEVKDIGEFKIFGSFVKSIIEKFKYRDFKFPIVCLDLLTLYSAYVSYDYLPDYYINLLDEYRYSYLAKVQVEYIAYLHNKKKIPLEKISTKLLYGSANEYMNMIHHKFYTISDLLYNYNYRNVGQTTIGMVEVREDLLSRIK
jgi:hypothetical protein